MLKNLDSFDLECGKVSVNSGLHLLAQEPLDKSLEFEVLRQVGAGFWVVIELVSLLNLDEIFPGPNVDYELVLLQLIFPAQKIQSQIVFDSCDDLRFAGMDSLVFQVLIFRLDMLQS